MLGVLQDKDLLHLIHFDNAVDLLFAVITEGVEIGTKDNVVEKNVNPYILMGLERSLTLE